MMHVIKFSVVPIAPSAWRECWPCAAEPRWGGGGWRPAPTARYCCLITPAPQAVTASAVQNCQSSPPRKPHRRPAAMAPRSRSRVVQQAVTTLLISATSIADLPEGVLVRVLRFLPLRERYAAWGWAAETAFKLCALDTDPHVAATPASTRPAAAPTATATAAASAAAAAGQPLHVPFTPAPWNESAPVTLRTATPPPHLTASPPLRRLRSCAW